MEFLPNDWYSMKLMKVTAIALAAVLSAGLSGSPAQATPANGAINVKIELGDAQLDESTFLVYERHNVVPGPGPEVGLEDLVQNPSNYLGDLSVDVYPGGRRVVVGNSVDAWDFNLVRVTIESDYIRNLGVVADDLFGSETAAYDRTITRTAEGVSVTWVHPGDKWEVTEGNAEFAWDPITFGKVSPKIVGKKQVGKKLKVKGISAASLTPRAAKVKYQWFRGKTKIKGANKKTYKVKRADRGKKIRAKVTARAYGIKTRTFATKKVKIKNR